MSRVTFVFWFSGFFIFYSYLGYPLLLEILSLFKSAVRPAKRPYAQPPVTLLISAYNEEAVIEEKLLNSLASNYPRSLLEIVVVSDGSTDSTCDIVSRYAHQGVKLRHYEGRMGKTACLNRAVPRAEGEIVVFSDANSLYDKEAIRELVKNFSDDRIGFVTGRTLYVSADAKGAAASIGLYSKIEQWIKTLESEIGSCIGADGAIFAVRKELYQPLKAYDINDFVIPLVVIEQGYRGKLENGAFCYEETAGAAKKEFRRQVRITNRTIRAIVNRLYLLNPFGYGLLAFELCSHKVCRLLVPFVMLILLVTDLILSLTDEFYYFTFCAQLLFYLLGGFNYLSFKSKFSFLSRMSSLAHTFIMTNFAILSGWIKYLKGEASVVWVPSRQ
jgi:cellulose synthase/poly-beta-1,6-N-acetylglucosamine synthase-like glycosyltransferase